MAKILALAKQGKPVASLTQKKTTERSALEASFEERGESKGY